MKSKNLYQLERLLALLCLTGNFTIMMHLSTKKMMHLLCTFTQFPRTLAVENMQDQLLVLIQILHR